MLCLAIVIVVVVESSNYSIAQWRTLLVRLKLFPIKLIHCLLFSPKKVSTFDFDFSDSGESFIDTGSFLFPNTSYTIKRLTFTSNPSVPQSISKSSNNRMQ